MHRWLSHGFSCCIVVEHVISCHNTFFNSSSAARYSELKVLSVSGEHAPAGCCLESTRSHIASIDSIRTRISDTLIGFDASAVFLRVLRLPLATAAAFGAFAFFRSSRTTRMYSWRTWCKSAHISVETNSRIFGSHRMMCCPSVAEIISACSKLSK